MPSDVKCQPHPKQLHLLVLLKGCLPSQFTEKHCVTIELSATFSNEFYSANLPASSPTLAAPSANCYASLQWLLTQSENKMSRQTASRRTLSKDETFCTKLFLPRKVRGCFFCRTPFMSPLGSPTLVPGDAVQYQARFYDLQLPSPSPASKLQTSSNILETCTCWHLTIRTVPPPAAVSLPAHVQWSHALRASGATPRLLAEM